MSTLPVFRSLVLRKMATNAHVTATVTTGDCMEDMVCCTCVNCLMGLHCCVKTSDRMYENSKGRKRRAGRSREAANAHIEEIVTRRVNEKIESYVAGVKVVAEQAQVVADRIQVDNELRGIRTEMAKAKERDLFENYRRELALVDQRRNDMSGGGVSDCFTPFSSCSVETPIRNTGSVRPKAARVVVAQPLNVIRLEDDHIYDMPDEELVIPGNPFILPAGPSGSSNYETARNWWQ